MLTNRLINIKMRESVLNNAFLLFFIASYYRISIKELNYEENQLSFRLQSKKKFK